MAETPIYRDDIRRAKRARGAQASTIWTVGTSGGVLGLEQRLLSDDRRRDGGGEAPRADLRHARAGRGPARTPGREARGGTAERGYLHCGAHGAGHFVKMVHNGIEYGLMAAYAEGMNILQARRRRQARRSAPTPRRRRFANPAVSVPTSILRTIAEVWRHGSIISSWLLDLTAAALASESAARPASPAVSSDSGEGRWTVQAAIEDGVPAHVLSAALYSRFESRGHAEFANKVLSAMRLGFGGHHEGPG